MERRAVNEATPEASKTTKVGDSPEWIELFENTVDFTTDFNRPVPLNGPALVVGTDSKISNAGERQFPLQMRMKPQTFRNPRRRVSFLCEQFDVSEMRPSQIIGYDPLVDLPEGKDLVHHIDLFVCDDLLADRFRKPSECGSFSAFMHTAKGPCYQLLFAYDRGATGFRMPKMAGFAIGKGTPFSKLLLQIHYLIPKGGLEKDVTHIDRSGMNILVTPDLRQHNAGTVGLLDYGLTIPGKAPDFHFQFNCHGDVLARMLSKDLKEEKTKVDNEGVTFFATHLHTHGFGRKLWVDHERNGKVIGTFGKNLDYKGYGASQSYQFYEADSKFKTGDAMQAHCIYDTSNVDHPTNYGVDHGDEMCAFIMFYYPANPKVLYKMNHLCSLYPKRGNVTDKKRTIMW